MVVLVGDGEGVVAAAEAVTLASATRIALWLATTSGNAILRWDREGARPDQVLSAGRLQRKEKLRARRRIRLLLVVWDVRVLLLRHQW